MRVRILAAPYEERDGWALNVMLVDGTLYLEEHLTDEQLAQKYAYICIIISIACSWMWKERHASAPAATDVLRLLIRSVVYDRVPCSIGAS